MSTGWARGEREDGGACKVGRKVGEKGRKRSPAGGVEARARRSGMGGGGWGGRGAGEELLAAKRAGNMQHKGEEQGTLLKGKRGAKEPKRNGWGDVGTKGRRTEV